MVKVWLLLGYRNNNWFYAMVEHFVWNIWIYSQFSCKYPRGL